MSTRYKDLVNFCRYIPPYLLAGVCFLGAFSRFTHGEYTPWWYEFQEYHVPDDGSTTALVTPVMDTILGALILWKPTRFVACGTALIFLCIGLGVQVKAEKKFDMDLFLVMIGNVATLISWQDSGYMTLNRQVSVVRQQAPQPKVDVKSSPAHDLRRRR